MSNIQPVRERAAQLEALLNTRLVPTIADILPKAIGVSRERFMANVYAALRSTPALLEATPASIMTAVIRAAQAGLELDGVQAALVPFKEKGTPKATFIPMYQGLVRAMLRSGVVGGVQVPRLVYQGDQFSYCYGLEERLVHVPKPEHDNQTDDKILGGYCIVTLTSQERIWEFTPRRVFDAIRERSRGQTAWRSDFAAMCMKTCVRRVAKFVAQRAEQAEFSKMIARDEKFDAGIVEPDLEFDVPKGQGSGLDDLFMEPTAEDRAAEEQVFGDSGEKEVF